MCLSLSFSNTRVHARDRNAHRDAGGCRRFQDSSPSRSTLPGRKQRCVTPLTRIRLARARVSCASRVGARFHVPSVLDLVSDHTVGADASRSPGAKTGASAAEPPGRGVGAPRFVGPDPFAPRVLNVLCVSGVQRCVRPWLSRHRRGGSTLRHRTQRLLWPGGSDPKLV